MAIDAPMPRDAPVISATVPARRFVIERTKGSGGFGAILELAHNWADRAETNRHYELMARYVHPHFQRGANAPRQLSYDTAVANRGTFSVQSQAAVATEIEKYQAAQSKRAAE